MRLLLDTHALIWWKTSPAQLSDVAASALADPFSEIYVSAATAWEIATKFRLGKLSVAEKLINNFFAETLKAQFFPLSVEVSQGLRAGLLKGPYKDAFDRMLIAQALDKELTLVSNETAFDKFGVKRLW